MPLSYLGLVSGISNYFPLVFALDALLLRNSSIIVLETARSHLIPNMPWDSTLLIFSLIQLLSHGSYKGSPLIGLTSLPSGCGGFGETKALIVFFFFFFEVLIPTYRLA
jgi:hypothetical protein